MCWRVYGFFGSAFVCLALGIVVVGEDFVVVNGGRSFYVRYVLRGLFCFDFTGCGVLSVLEGGGAACSALCRDCCRLLTVFSLLSLALYLGLSSHDYSLSLFTVARDVGSGARRVVRIRDMSLGARCPARGVVGTGDAGIVVVELAVFL